MRLNWITAEVAAAYNLNLDKTRLAQAISEDAEGFGSFLENVLHSLGIDSSPYCKCPGRKDILNYWTKEYIVQNLDRVVEWLHEEAYKQGIPFSPSLTRLLLKGMLLI